jgi:hypothetical protein
LYFSLIRVILDDSREIIAGRTSMVDETKTIGEDVLPLAKAQRRWSMTQKGRQRDKADGR